MDYKKRHVRDDIEENDKRYKQLKDLFFLENIEDAYKLLNYIINSFEAEDEDYLQNGLDDDIEELKYLISEANKMLSWVK